MKIYESPRSEAVEFVTLPVLQALSFGQGNDGTSGEVDAPARRANDDFSWGEL